MANLLPESVAIQPGEIIAILRVTPDGEGREAAPHIHTSAETATSDGARERPEWSRVASLVHRMSDPIVDHANESREKEFGSKEEAAAEQRNQHMSTRRMRKAANEEIWAAARRYEKLMTTTGVFSPATADGNFEKQLKLSRLVWEYADVFEDDPRVVMANSNVAHHIPTGDAKPIKCHPHNRSPHEKEIISRHMKVMLEEGAIKRVKSPWAAQVVLTPKPDGSWRFCVDYSKLGKVTVRDSYPMPKIESILNSTVGANWFSAHDLKSGYWQCPMATNDGSDLKTAFCTADGQFAWRVMPFGLRNSGATMMRMVDEALQGLLWESAAAYIDDCLVYSAGDFDNHLSHLRAFYSRIRRSGLHIKPVKCHLGRHRVDMLGHTVDGTSRTPKESNVAALIDFPRPTSQRGVEQFVGLASFFRQYVNSEGRTFAELAAPLYQLKKGGKKVHRE